MPVSLRCVDPQAIIVGYDFSTGSVKALAFGVDGQAHTEVRFPTELFTEGGVSELSYLQLEGQALATPGPLQPTWPTCKWSRTGWPVGSRQRTTPQAGSTTVATRSGG